jgi:hypothetical protein
MRNDEKQCLSTTIPQDLLLSLKVFAIKREVCINALVKEALEDLLNKYKDKYTRPTFSSF